MPRHPKVNQQPQIPNLSKDMLRNVTKMSTQLLKQMNPDMANKVDSIDENELVGTVENMFGNLMGGANGQNPLQALLGGLGSMQMEQPQSNNEGVMGEKPNTLEIDTENVKSIDTQVKKCKDIKIVMNVTLEDMYYGRTKKIYIKRKRLDKNDNIVVEKYKLRIPIEAGSQDSDEIIFEGEGHQSPGYQNGDIVVTLDCQSHNIFTRYGDDLIMDLDVSIGEVYQLDTVITGIDNKQYRIQSVGSDILYTNDGMRRVEGLGMPVKGSSGQYGNLIIRFNVEFNSEKLNDSQIQELKNMFAPMNKDGTEFKDLPIYNLEQEDPDYFNELLEEITDSEREDSEQESEENYIEESE